MKWLFDWNDATNPERAELVFANRNKEYGAYQLRKKYEKRVINALLIAVGAVALAVVVPIIANMISKVDFGNNVKVLEDVTLMDPPPIDKSTPPPPPVIPPPPVQQTIKFTPPKVVKDEEVEEPPPTQEETKEVQVSTETHEGDKNAVELPPETPIGNDEGTIFTIVEEQPDFPGGQEKLFEFIQKNTKYPPVARENQVTGRVFVNFVVDKDGKIKDAKVIRGIGAGCDEEALRVVRSMPTWKPGRQNGRSVPVYFNLPINFTLK